MTWLLLGFIWESFCIGTFEIKWIGDMVDPSYFVFELCEFDPLYPYS